MKVLLSIKPEFVDKIFDRTKRYEYRKTLFKKENVSSVIVYASAPIKKVVGEFHVDGIISDNVDSLWEKTSKFAGITKDYYNAYFQSKNTANAIVIGHIKKYKEPKQLSDFKIKHAPQSFCYVAFEE